jgi:hypothetical protein
MLLLQLNTANKLYVVCDDILTITSPTYLWRFYDEARNKEFLIEIANEQATNHRFDLFTLTLPTDLDLKESIYIWEIYESDTPGDEDYANMNLLSNGTARVGATFTENTSYEPTGNDVVYDG